MKTKFVLALFAAIAAIAVVGCSGEPAPTAGDAEAAKGMETTNPPAKALREQSEAKPRTAPSDLRGQ
ncbi:MAG: hypothetical protein KF824_13260 [Fimbriimonadaceae bacterium]|nr:MAG: hypothetical protein KF824_13260 [Fimbriimonadaceae bacterium]